MVQKSDWKTIDMPRKNEQFSLARKLTDEELSALRRGILPREMEDKWFVYWADDTLYIHRSWTGYCIYQVRMESGAEVLRVTVNRDPDQYRETNISRDSVNLNMLLNIWIRTNSDVRR